MSEPMLVSEVASGDRKRVVKLLVVAAVVLALALVLPKVLFGGGDDAADDFDFGSTPTTAVPQLGTPGEAPVEVERIFSTRNPFTPLVASAETAGPAAPTEGEAVPVVEPEAPIVLDPGIVLPTFPVTPPDTTAPPVTPPTTVAPPAPQPGETRFALAEVFQDPAGQVLARVRINDVVHEVVVGHDFAQHYRFVSADLAARCASFLYGDTRFELCEGEETRP